MTIEEFIAYVEGRGLAPRKSGAGWIARCPVCDKSDAPPEHLTIAAGDDGRILFKCQKSDCDFNSVVGALDLKPTDMFPEKQEKPRKLGFSERIVETYPYTDEQDQYLYETVRLRSPKTFRQRVRDVAAKGGYRWTIKGVRRVLYHLRLLLAAVKAGASILIVEGEKDTHTAERIGFTATCNAMGALKWEASYSESLRGASRVAIIADKDPDSDEKGTLHRKGQRHAAQVARSLETVGVRAVVLELPDREGQHVKDLSDWVDAGGTPEELEALISTQAVDGLVYADAIERWTKENSPSKGLKEDGPRNGDRRPVVQLPANLEDAATLLLTRLVELSAPTPTLFTWADGIAELGRAVDGALRLDRLSSKDKVRETVGRRLDFEHLVLVKSELTDPSAKEVNNG